MLDSAEAVFFARMLAFAYLLGAVPAILATLATRLSDLVLTRTRTRLAAAIPIGGFAALLVEFVFRAPEIILSLLATGAAVALCTTALTQWLFRRAPRPA